MPLIKLMLNIKIETIWPLIMGETQRFSFPTKHIMGIITYMRDINSLYNKIF